jgi:hypothetical protein
MKVNANTINEAIIHNITITFNFNDGTKQFNPKTFVQAEQKLFRKMEMNVDLPAITKIIQNG